MLAAGRVGADHVFYDIREGILQYATHRERERATNLSRLGLLICQGCTETVAYCGASYWTNDATSYYYYLLAIGYKRPFKYN